MPALLRLLYERQLVGAECASIAELALAKAANIPSSSTIFDSPAKTDDHLRYAIQHGVHVNADSFEELARIENMLNTITTTTATNNPSIGLRVNPQLGTAEIAETFTAAAACKFGEPLRESYDDIIAAYLRYPFLNTVHVHVGSQGCHMDVLVAGAKAAVELARKVNHKAPGRVTQIDIGGGLSVDYWSDGQGTSFEQFAQLLKEQVAGLFDFRILTEFGRRIAADSAFIAARVQSVKRSGGKVFVVCHVGADLLVRPVYQREKWGHRIEIYDAQGNLRTGATTTVDIAGPICFAGDVIARDRKLPMPQVGDFVVVRDTGAYTMSMYCRHTSQLVPAVYGFEEDEPGKLRTLKKQESLEDVMRFWGAGE